MSRKDLDGDSRRSGDDAVSAGRRRCFLSVSIGGEIQPRPIVIDLKINKCPKTCQSFIELCTSTETTSRQRPCPSYKGCEFHRIVPGFCVQAGDFERFDGTGGYSPLFGRNFDDENLQSHVGQNKHDQEGVVSMANSGRDTNGSQFFITLKAVPHLDPKHVVFGQVVEGMDTVRKMTSVERDSKDRPIQIQRIRIEDCGVGSGHVHRNSHRRSHENGEEGDDRNNKKRKRKKNENDRSQHKKSHERSSSSKHIDKTSYKNRKRRHDRDDDDDGTSDDSASTYGSSSRSSSSEESENKEKRRDHKQKTKKKRKRSYKSDTNSESSGEDMSSSKSRSTKGKSVSKKSKRKERPKRSERHEKKDRKKKQNRK